MGTARCPPKPNKQKKTLSKNHRLNVGLLTLFWKYVKIFLKERISNNYHGDAIPLPQQVFFCQSSLIKFLLSIAPFFLLFQGKSLIYYLLV